MKYTDFIKKGAAVKRYHAHFTVTEQTVGAHSHRVALIAMLIAGEHCGTLLWNIMIHDMAEQFTGDIPGDVKNATGIRPALKDYEQIMMFQHSPFKEIVMNDDHKHTLKAADILDGLLYCQEEMALGNKDMQNIAQVYVLMYQDLPEFKNKVIADELFFEITGQRHRYLTIFDATGA